MLNVQEISEIINLVDQSSINEFTYETNGTSISMKKSVQQSVTQVSEKVSEPIQQPQTEVAPVVLQPETPVEKTQEQMKSPAVEKEVAYDYEIVSPMVGTLYAAPSPESDLFVKQGSKVTNDTVVCIVEAMKLFNEIEAEVTGEIVEVLVEDGVLVEYGQPLFRVKGN